MLQEQVLRQWKILVLLDQNKNGMSPDELAAEIKTNVRTIYRDLATLQEVGFPFSSEKTDGITRYYLVNDPGIIRQLNLGPTELLALYLSQGILSQLKGTLFQQAIDQLLEKVGAILPKTGREYFQGLEANIIIELFNRRDYRSKAKQIQAIVSSLRDRKVLRMNYSSPNRGAMEREVEPYHLWVMGDSLYLIGFCRVNKEIRTFLVDRINAAAATKKPFTLKDGFDFKKYSQESFRVMRSGETLEFELKFDPHVAYLVKERLWHPSQKIKTNPDGSVILSFSAKGLEEVKSWALSFGENVEVLKPAKLRQEIKSACSKMLKKYV